MADGSTDSVVVSIGGSILVPGSNDSEYISKLASMLRDARLTLVECTKIVLADVLDCLGMGAPEEM